MEYRVVHVCSTLACESYVTEFLFTVLEQATVLVGGVAVVQA